MQRGHFSEGKNCQHCENFTNCFLEEGSKIYKPTYILFSRCPRPVQDQVLFGSEYSQMYHKYLVLKRCR